MFFFKPTRSLEHKGITLPYTTTITVSMCEIQFVNMGEEHPFLHVGIQLGTISNACVDVSRHIKILGSQEVHNSMPEKCR